MYCIEFRNLTFVANKINCSLIQTHSVFLEPVSAIMLEIYMHWKLIHETIQHTRYLSAHAYIVLLSANRDSEPTQSRIEMQKKDEETLPSSRVRDQVPLLQKTRESHVNNSHVME